MEKSDQSYNTLLEGLRERSRYNTPKSYNPEKCDPDCILLNTNGKGIDEFYPNSKITNEEKIGVWLSGISDLKKSEMLNVKPFEDLNSCIEEESISNLSTPENLKTFSDTFVELEEWVEI